MIGNLFSYTSVVLSAAKVFIAACHEHEILGCARDDSNHNPELTTKVSATNVLRQPIRSAVTASPPTRARHLILGVTSSPKICIWSKSSCTELAAK